MLREREVKNEENRGRLTITIGKELKRHFHETLIRREATAVKVINDFIRQYVIDELGEDAVSEIE